MTRDPLQSATQILQMAIEHLKHVYENTPHTVPGRLMQEQAAMLEVSLVELCSDLRESPDAGLISEPFANMLGRNIYNDKRIRDQQLPALLLVALGQSQTIIEKLIERQS